MLVTLIFFIIGATLGSAHLEWWLALPNARHISIVQELGWWQALFLQLMVFAFLYYLVRAFEIKQAATSTHQVANNDVGRRLLKGPWSLWWGVFGLLLFNLATMLLAGHPWSITFAFGLWGAKIWQALGGDLSTVSYWSTGYPARALNSSVLADVTSIMNFGIILGAILAAALAGRFALEHPLKRKRIMTAVVGGLLLGYGARLAYGCNIGALLAGISTGSVHGWLWLVAGFGGSWFGVWLRQQIGIDPLMRKT